MQLFLKTDPLKPLRCCWSSSWNKLMQCILCFPRCLTITISASRLVFSIEEIRMRKSYIVPWNVFIRYEWHHRSSLTVMRVQYFTTNFQPVIAKHVFCCRLKQTWIVNWQRCSLIFLMAIYVYISSGMFVIRRWQRQRHWRSSFLIAHQHHLGYSVPSLQF